MGIVGKISFLVLSVSVVWVSQVPSSFASFSGLAKAADCNGWASLKRAGYKIPRPISSAQSKQETLFEGKENPPACWAVHKGLFESFDTCVKECDTADPASPYGKALSEIEGVYASCDAYSEFCKTNTVQVPLKAGEDPKKISCATKFFVFSDLRTNPASIKKGTSKNAVLVKAQREYCMKKESCAAAATSLKTAMEQCRAKFPNFKSSADCGAETKKKHSLVNATGSAAFALQKGMAELPVGAGTLLYAIQQMRRPRAALVATAADFETKFQAAFEAASAKRSSFASDAEWQTWRDQIEAAKPNLNELAKNLKTNNDALESFLPGYYSKGCASSPTTEIITTGTIKEVPKGAEATESDDGSSAGTEVK